MSESEHQSKSKRVVRNIAYSFLVYCGAFYILVMILDRSVLTHPSFSPQLTAKDFLAVVLGIAVAVAFYRWFAKRKSQ